VTGRLTDHLPRAEARLARAESGKKRRCTKRAEFLYAAVA